MCFSRVGRSHKFDYSVAFSDCQHLQQIRKKILKAQSALENSLVVSKGFETIYKSLVVHHKVKPQDHITREVHMHILDIEAHLRTIASMLERASWVAAMVSAHFSFSLFVLVDC